MSDISEKNSQCGSVASEASGSNSTFSRASFNPTVDGGETPFEEFAWSVQQLCKKFWPADYEEVTITRLDGGSFNRIVGLSVKPSLALTGKTAPALPDTKSHEDRSEHYILRISRDDDSDVADHIMVLFYIRTHTSLPIPRVVAFDIGSENILERPYTLQQRMPGIPLDTIISKLTFDQRRSLAIQVAQIIKQIQDVESPVAGQIGIPTLTQQVPSEDPSSERQGTGPVEASLEKKLAFMTMTGLPSDTSEAQMSFSKVETETSSMETLQILHFDFKTAFSRDDPYNGVVNTVKSETLPVLSYFNFQFVRHMLRVLQTKSTDYILTRMYHQLMQIALEMDELHCLGKDVFNFYHGDLEPRNILVHVCDFGEIHIAGILDWDNSAFVPRAVSCMAPRWIWSIKEDLDSHERDDEEDPSDPEQIALKEAFDDAIGYDWVDMAYSPEYRLVRRLFRLSIGGIQSNESFDEVESLTKEWAELRRTLKEDKLKDNVSEGDASKNDDTSKDDDATKDDASEDDTSTTS